MRHSKTHKLIDSFNAAIEGFLYVVKMERNMRIHFIIALLVILLGIFLNFTRTEMMILCLTIGFVLLAEMVNTAIEVVINSIAKSYVHWVKVVKDISAAAVLIAAINAIIIGYFLFFRHNLIYQFFVGGLEKVSTSGWHASFFIIIVLIGIVIGAKALFRKGTPLRGGMPSGHSAVAFSIWTLVALISQNPLLIFIVFILAFMIAQSRVGRHYHTFFEVIAGALLGIFTTIMLYRLLIG